MDETEQYVEFTPIGLTRTVKLKVLSEDKRPRCCPDPFGCKPIVLSSGASQENIDKGYSGSCYGYCGRHKFDYKEVQHENDISHCVMTPLKGCIRFFNNVGDFWNDELDVRRIRAMISPASCDFCGLTNFWHPITDMIVNKAELQSGAEKEERRKNVCERCSLRLGFVQYHPENEGTDRPLYW